MDYFILCRNKE